MEAPPIMNIKVTFINSTPTCVQLNLIKPSVLPSVLHGDCRKHDEGRNPSCDVEAEVVVAFVFCG